MNAREKAEFDRVNALPRKSSGTVAYYFKPQTKYPPRIYVFMHAEIWCDRNRRPMGLHTAFPFLTRPMNREEIEYHHFDTRLCYHQYEDWSKLLYAEEKEAGELDRENTGIGAAFLERLRSFQLRFPLTSVAAIAQIIKPSQNEEILYLEVLLAKQNLPTQEVSRLLDQEQKGEKRLTVLILLREMYKAAAGAPNQLHRMTIAVVLRKAERSLERTRKNFVRRIYKANPLFALEEIRRRYQDYDAVLLTQDLHRSSPKPKRSKQPPVLDLRRVQLQKLAAKLKQVPDDDTQYHSICQRMAILQEAHSKRCPIPIAVKLDGQTEVYYFHWKTRETVVKAFVAFADQSGQTHAALKQRHHEVTASVYSF